MDSVNDVRLLRFDRDELGIDPETDEDEDVFCEDCGELLEDCECEEEE